MASPISLKNYISRRFSAMAILPVITLAGLTLGIMMPAIKTRTNIQQQGLARSIADQLSARLAGGERQLTALAEYLNSRPFTPDSALTDLLDAQCGNGEFFEALFIIDDTTFSVQATGLARARRQRRSDFTRLDFSGHRFISPPKNAQPALWSEIFLSTVNSRPVVSLTLPLSKGFIVGELTLDKLAGFITPLPQASKLLTLIIDEHGTVIADSQRRYWGHIFPDSVVSGPESTDNFLTNSRTFELNGQKMLGAVATFEKTGWNILTAQPVQHVYQPLWEILSLIGVGLAATLILALPIAWFLAGKFSRIFTSYTERAASLARGNYDIHWPEYKTKESLLLGQSLMDMAQKIEQREKELKAQEQRTRDFLVNVPGVIYQYTVDPKDPESGTFTSPAIEKCIEIFELDFEQKNFVGLFEACIPENDRTRFRLSVKKSLESHSPWHYEGRFIKPSGKEIWFEGRSHPRQTDGLISHYGVFTDITRRKELEASLRLTQFCFDKAPIGIWRIEKNGNILDVNEHGCESLGYSQRELCRMSVFDFAPAFTIRDWENAKAHWNRTDPRPIEARHQRRNGEIFPIQIIQKNMTFENREYCMAFIQDITEQKKVEQILQKNETDLRQLRNYLVNIIDSMPSIIVAVDSGGRITLWNHLAEKETGLDVATALSQPLGKLFPRLAHVTDRIKTAIREQRVISTQKLASQWENEMRFEDITIFPLKANGVDGAVIRVDDVTDQVRMEEIMIQNEKMLSVGGLAAGMAHEINNPLAGIVQTAQVMGQRLTADLDIPAGRKAATEADTSIESIDRFMKSRGIPRMIQTIIESGQRVSEIVNNILSFSRKDQTIVSTHFLDKILDKTLELAGTDYDFKKAYDFKQIQITREYDPNLHAVPCQAGKIQQVVLNILTNGAQAMQEDRTPEPKFILRTYADPVRNMACFEIEDNGPGMDEKTRKQIFDPFFTTKPVGVGTGLGLSVSYFIITETHKGEMMAESSPGVGSKFIIRLAFD